eukprot:GILK01011329.1.p1 GENE.GILK01011329.1~~GILK01011329.1.p1  ORF type:complete len:280 (+),score=52.37 GILK01011329.1:58-897(+)
MSTDKGSSSQSDDDNSNIDLNTKVDDETKIPENSQQSISFPTAHGLDVSFPLRALNPQLTCLLCGGYFKEATTITECLHTFCKSCIVSCFNAGESRCPNCGEHLGVNPMETLRLDRTIQHIVDKLFPDLIQEDARQEALLYDFCGLQKPLDDSEEALVKAEPNGQNGKERPNKRQKTEATGTAAPRVQQADQEINFVLEPEDSSMEALPRPFLRTSKKLTMLHAKKYLVKKLNLSSVNEVELLCQKEKLGNEYTLEFVYTTRWFKPERDLLLNYRVVKH